ncbi:MAG TPA: phosphoribosylanthranilate isomerase [Polyangiaceae bacterium]|nr:phosphoribosylanthranilate isomerase [Polyangiaceae bacterium]
MSERPELWVKICGVTREEDARAAVAAGASALGLNFVTRSKRYVDVALARRLADAVRGEIELVGVVADEPVERIRELMLEVGLDSVQLHGGEPPEFLQALPKAFKAIGIEGPSDVSAAQAFVGARLLVDAKSAGVTGGTGHAFDWRLVEALARRRPIILAGGLRPDNVADAVRQVAPYGVDVAGGVELEGEPRHKDADKIKRFIENARNAVQR